ncbi:MAG: nucleotidyltransferase domain-containing protein [Anaerolineae bacterium]|jgi:predicted nucleotidyltransferase|nr:nucleotidyltransferase domain-containing protein [Anaerolineae bacterium]
MQREAVVRTLSAYKQEFSAKYGVTRLGVFGSVGRKEAGGVSDVDIVVEMPPDLLKMVPMKEDLEEVLAASLALIRHSHFLNDFFKRHVDHEAIHV